MNTAARGALLLAVISTTTLVTAQGQVGAPSSASLGETAVPLYVTVEEDGKVVRGLTKENFHLLVNGEPAPFELQEPERPASIVLLVERSLASRYYSEDIAAAMRVFPETAPDGHWYALATFEHDMQIDVDFTKDRLRVQNAFFDLPEPTWTDLNTCDAISQVLDRMARLEGRRIMVFIGSGLDSGSSKNRDTIGRQLQSTDVQVFGIGTTSSLRNRLEPAFGFDGPNLTAGEMFIRSMAADTGGHAEFPPYSFAYPDALAKIMWIIEHQYKLVYAPPVRARGELHKIELTAWRMEEGEPEELDVYVRRRWRP